MIDEGPRRQKITKACLGLRASRASATRGHFCRHPEHAESDYVFYEPKNDAKDQEVPKWACGACWPKETNPGWRR